MRLLNMLMDKSKAHVPCHMILSATLVAKALLQITMPNNQANFFLNIVNVKCYN